MQERRDVAAWHTAQSQLLDTLQPTDSLCSVDVKFSALALRIGFDDSLLITRALSCLSKAQTDAGAPAEDASNDGTTAAGDAGDAGNGGSAALGSNEAKGEDANASSETKTGENDESDGAAKMLIVAKVDIPIVVIDLINDLGRRQLPLLQMRFRRLGVAVQMLGDIIDADVLLAANAVFYNEKLTVWEPMLEPWSCCVL